MGFEEYSTPVPLIELHLDYDQVKQQVKVKEEAIERQEGGKNKDKKNKKSRKKKGLSAFLDEGEEYEKAAGETKENSSTNEVEE